MRCPNITEIREDWQRSKRGEPMLHASHIASCSDCHKKIEEFKLFSQAITTAGEQSAHGKHIEPEIQAAYVENTLSSTEQRNVESHLADCSECREAIADLAQVVYATKPKRVPLWAKALTNSVYFVGGATAALLVLFLLPSTIPTVTSKPTGVIIYGTKGGTSAAAAAMRAIEPSDSDLDFAIAVWESVTKANPNDRAAQIKLAELKKRKANLKSRP